LTPALAVSCALALAGVGCGERVDGTVHLIDGSVAPRAPGALRRAVGIPVTSRVRVLRAAALDARGRACLDSFRGEFDIPLRAVVVERVGVLGASLTAADAGRRVVVGCDRSGRDPPDRRWCARSVGRLSAGRLQDPRVDILCRDARGRPLAFGWVEPAPGARWIVMAGPGSIERVAAGLPVRVVTHRVDTPTSSATFDGAEYRPAGVLLRRYSLRATVAG
jgi:hypothetical protein